MSRFTCLGVLLLEASVAFALGEFTTASAQQPLVDMSSGHGLFHNVKAVDVGDVVTILIVESASGNTVTASETKNKTESTMGPNLGLLSLLPDWNLENENKFKGDGKSSRAGNLNARISARIVEKLPNGNLRIEGTRVVEVNSERQIITLRGLIRPRDINSRNTVMSTYIADAEIVYSGRGPIEDAHSPGIFTRVLNWFF